VAIRIRVSNGITIALCAVESDPLPGDVYLDDAQHYALAAKFADDWNGQTISWQYPSELSEMRKHRARGAKETLETWLEEWPNGQARSAVAP